MITRNQFGLILIFSLITNNHGFAANIQRDLLGHTQGQVQDYTITGYEATHLSQLYNNPVPDKEAIETQQRIIAVIERGYGKNHLYVAAEVTKLAELYTRQNRLAEAEPLLKRALIIYQKVYGKDHRDVADSLYRLAMLYQQQGHYAKAEPLLRLVLQADVKLYGKDSLITSDSIESLATLYRYQAHYIKAEELYKQALAIRENFHGNDHLDVASTLNNLGLCYLQQGRYADAEPLLRRSLAISVKLYDKQNPLVANTLSNLASLNQYQGNYAEAVKLHKQALAIKQQLFAQNDPEIAISLNNLALAYKDQGNYADAEAYIKQALVVVEKAYGKEHPSISASLNNLAIIYQEQGKHADAEALLNRALAIDEKFHGKEHPNVANSLNNLAHIYQQQGQYSRAEPLLLRALALDEKLLGENHFHIAIELNNLALVYQNQGRYERAAPLYKRSIAILNKIHGNKHPLIAACLKNLATLYQYQGQFIEAEKLHKQALAIRKRIHGSGHPDVASSMNGLAAGYVKQGDYAKAGPLLQQALAIYINNYGKEHPLVANTLINLALMHQYQRQFIEAEKLYKRALQIRENILGRQHPHVAITLNNMATLYYKQGRYDDALAYARRVTAIYRHRFIRPQAVRSGSPVDEQHSVQITFLNHINSLAQQLQDNAIDTEALTAEALEVSQLARSTGAAQALAQMATRFAAGGDVLAKHVREYQDTLSRWRQLDNLLIREFSKPKDSRQPDNKKRLRRDLEKLDKQLLDLGTALARDFPEYAALANPAPVALKDVQGLLQPDEAILSYLIGERDTYLFVVRKGRIKLHRINLNGTQLDTIVRTLRKGLDSKNMLDPSHTIDPRLEYHDLKPYKIPRFDIELAHALYRQLIFPAERMLDGVKHIMVVPDGALTSLPYGVLVTEKPGTTIKLLRQYRQVPWLTQKYAISTLPSISALRVLRYFAKDSRANRPLVGFGDPLLGDELVSDPSMHARSTQALLTRGVIADADTVRRAFTRLPETRQELLAIANTLNTSSASLYLQERATETQLRSMTLSPYRVVAFATHGLMAGEFKGVAEPALVLTPPRLASKDDDGLLTASEVATLKLDADWVILSACNTAAADGTPGAQGLSGLARSFFYAGSRALLVSHWYVVSDSTVQLQTAMFKALAAQPGMGRAEALRRSRQQLMQQKHKPWVAHPMFWAPFVVVGEGGAKYRGE